METDRRDQSAVWRRYRPLGVTPLELWDVRTLGETLFAAKAAPDFAARLARAVAELRAGAAEREGGARLPVVEFEAIHLGGGGVTERIATALGELAPVTRDGAFVAEPGGRALLGERDGAIVDAGQTAIKLLWPGARELVPRAAHVNLRELLAGALAKIPAAHAQHVVLALPSELDDDLVPGACSYPDLAGDRAFVANVLRDAALAPRTLLVLNDAELAAESARTLDSPRPTLVLTIGFGVGGALLR